MGGDCADAAAQQCTATGHGTQRVRTDVPALSCFPSCAERSRDRNGGVGVGGGCDERSSIAFRSRGRRTERVCSRLALRADVLG